MINVILLEDEPVLREELRDFLEEQGYIPHCVANLKEFDQLFDAKRHRLAIIDIGLPDGNGLQLIQRLREAQDPIGIIVFSARNTSNDRVNGLNVGADHYLGKGCDLDELIATLTALARRLKLSLPSPAGWQLELGPRRLLPPSAQAVPLSQQDLVVLQCLMRQAHHNVSRREIIHALGAEFLDYDLRRIDTQMSRLRRRVHEISGVSLPIKTLRNEGYCFYQAAQIRA
ncbi:response regulator transcription factor [uncultured Oxalicibacterium sp.]|uniref:response regulator transcription factor n=1 Tax=uncultured Oxalicibacterium sp. TaxID=1168540 RepID=UPI0025CD1EE6|nr:response regulator transcription factor [uncultured Oxalicibacterium sp.]